MQNELVTDMPAILLRRLDDLAELGEAAGDLHQAAEVVLHAAEAQGGLHPTAA